MTKKLFITAITQNLKKKKNMRNYRKIAAILLTLITLSAHAQKGDLSLIPHVRAGYANITNTIDDRLRDYFIGDLGAECEYMVTDALGVALGLDLSSSFALKKNGASVVIGSAGSDDSAMDFLNINVSLLAQYHIGQFALQAGLQMNNTVGGDAYRNSKNVIITPGMNGSPGYDVFRRTFYSIPVGVTYEFKEYPLLLGVRYNLPITKINKLQTEKDSHMSSIMLSLGYRLFD